MDQALGSGEKSDLSFALKGLPVRRVGGRQGENHGHREQNMCSGICWVLLGPKGSS